MMPERWAVIKQIFAEAAEREPPARDRFVADRCGDDLGLRQEVERLLASSAACADFIENSPLGGIAADLASRGRFTGLTRGHYRLGDRVASGGMGEVYDATDVRTGVRVAIKVLTVDDAGARDRLKREAGHASALDHPNICKVLEVGEDEYGAYIAMEFLEGAVLVDAVPKTGFEPAAALSLALQLASAIGHAHANQIVHRDLKSGNVMLLPDGRLKVLDFGLARRLPTEVQSAVSAASVTQAGVIAGTLSYLAPEVLKGERADSRSDIWAFGIVLHELLTGQQPFDGHTAFELTSEVLREPPRALPSEVPAGLRTIRDNCLAKDPARRYQNGEELLEALRSFQSGARVRRRTESQWPRAMAAVTMLIVLAFGTGIWWRTKRANLPQRTTLLAVLPFRDTSGVTGDAYFGDGVAEALTDRLGTLGSVRVLSHQSVKRLGQKPALDALSRELPADLIVRGSVEQVADRVRLTAELVDAASNRQLGRDTFERPANEILAVENDVVRAIADWLAIPLSRELQKSMSAVRAVDPVVYEAYLKGRFQWNKRTSGSLDRAVEYFMSAIERDPTYAPAHAALADCYNQQGTVLVSSASPVDMRPRARAEAIAAIQIDDALAEAHATLAYVSHYDWDWATAEREFRRALELNPNIALVRAWHSNYLVSRGRFDDAVNEVRRAEELDPFSLVVVTNVGWTLSNARRPQEAIAAYRRALALDASYVQARMRLGAELANVGQFGDAIDEHRRVVEMTHRSPAALASLAQTYAKAGKMRESQTVLAELLDLSKRSYVSPVNLYLTFFLLGDRERGFALLDQAFRERSNGLVYLMVEPSLESVRRDPRFLRVAEQVGLPR
jgi:eukaryotic-like serine/threonine-protein kinase